MLADSLVLLTHPTWEIHSFGELLGVLPTIPQADCFQMQVPEALHPIQVILVSEINSLQSSNVKLV